MGLDSPTDRTTPLLSAAEVADLLGITTRTVRRLADDGELRRIVLGRRMVRYSAEDVGALIGRSTMYPETRNVAPAGDAPKTRGTTRDHAEA